MPPVVEKVL